MKLRTDGHSLRLRLSPADIELFKEARQLQEILHLPKGQSFTYGLYLSEQGTQADIQCSNRNIAVYLPKGDAKKWIENENMEGLYYQLPTQNEQTIRLLIEKDQPCRHTTAK